MVIEAGFAALEGRRASEDLLAVLYGNDTTRGKRVSVTAAIDLIHDGSVEIAATQKIGVQRVHLEIVDGLIRRHERLPEDLPAVNLRAADVATLAAKQVDLESLEFELPQQIDHAYVHDAVTPKRFCITGLVVVYCKNCFFSGYSQL